MSGLRFIEKLASAPWLCDQEHVEFLHSIFLRYLDRAASGQPLDRQAVEMEVGRPLDNARAVTVCGGVATIPVTGTLVRRANLFSNISGGVSTEMVAKDLRAARDDPAVHSILMVFDSPGGEATGINELAGQIRNIRDSEATDTRIEAYCDGDCASAAYWLASATERITTDATATLGSIGVVTRIRNPEAAGKQAHLEFWNSQSPKKRISPNTETGKAAIQGLLDDVAEEFIQSVASNRGVSAKTVMEDFGQGFVLVGRKAVAAGLADAVGSEEEVIERLNDRTVDYGRMAAVNAYAEEKPRLNAAEVTDQQIADSAAPGTRKKADKITEKPMTGTTGAVGKENAEGMVSRIRAMLGGETVPIVPARSEEPSERNGVKLKEGTDGTVLVAENGEELFINAEDQDAIAGRSKQRDAILTEENAELQRRLVEASDRVEALEAEATKATQDLRTAEIDRELDALRSSGVPPYMCDAARPTLLAGDTEEAERWRTVLEGSKGGVQYGERGAGDGKPTNEMSDHERVQAAMAERGLGNESYSTVVDELVASGEIRRGA